MKKYVHTLEAVSNQQIVGQFISGMIDYEKQERFLDELVSWLRSAQSSLRSEELFEDVDDIITEVTYKMKEFKE